MCKSSTTSATGSYLRSLRHLSQLGLWINWQKSKLVPMQRIYFSRHGVGFGQLDSTPHPVMCSVGAEMPQDFIRQDGGPTKFFSEAVGAYGCSCGDSSARSVPYETTSALAPWMSPEVGVESATHRVQITPACRTTFSPWIDPSFLWAGVPLEQVSKHSVVFTEASATGWGATYNGHAVSGVWTGPQLHWHTNFLELLAVLLALSCLRVHIRFTLLSHVITRLSPPPLESEASEVASCHPHSRSVQSGGQRAVSSGTSWGVETPSLGSPADLETVWSCSGRPVCISRNCPLPLVLLPFRGNAWHGCIGTQLIPPVSLLAQTLCKVREDEEQVC